MGAPSGPDQPRDDRPTREHEQYPDEPYQQQPYQQPYREQPYGHQYPPPPPPQGYDPSQPTTQWGQAPSYGQQQYGQPSYDPQYAQQPYGYYPQAAPSRSGRTAWLVGAAAVVVVAVVIGGVVLLTRGGGSKKDAQASRSSTSPSSTAPTSVGPSSTSPTKPSASSSQPAPPDSVRSITVPSLISGWHGVLSPDEKVAYDVPPGWSVQTPDTLVGFENNKGQPIAVMHGVSTYKDDACPKVSGSYRGQTGFKTAGDLAPAVAARAGVRLFAGGVALRDNGSSAPISGTTLKRITVDQGKISAEYARATVAVKSLSDCGSPSVVVVAVAFHSAAGKTALFIGYFDQGVKDALPLSTAERIFTTLRPYKG